MKSLIRLSLLSCVLLLSSCTPDSNPVVVTPAPTHSISPAAQSISNVSDKIQSTEEFQSCIKTNVNMCVQQVASELARKNKDVSMCKELPTPEARGGCEFSVVMTDAAGKDDISICNSLSEANYKGECQRMFYQKEAIAKKDPSLCQKYMGNADTSTGSVNLGKVDQCILQVVLSDPKSEVSDCKKISKLEVLNECTTLIKIRSTEK